MTLDMLRDVSDLYSGIQITFKLLVDNATEKILRACTFETSLDGYGWVSSGLTTGFYVLEIFQTTLIGKPACIHSGRFGGDRNSRVQYFNRSPWI